MGDSETYAAKANPALRQHDNYRRSALAADWASANPILRRGEVGAVIDTGEIRVGDGVTPWASLPGPSGTYARLAPVLSPFSALTRALVEGGRSVSFSVVSDSTGQMSGSWTEGLMTRLAALYPAYTVWRVMWDDTNQVMTPGPTVVQSGTGNGGGLRGVQFSGGGNAYVASSITGDLEVIAHVNPTAWANGSVNYTIASKNASAPNKGWYFTLTSSGALQINWSADGTTQITSTSSALTSAVFSNGSPGWVRVTLDVDNGATGNDAKFYTSPDGITWTQLGTTITKAGVTSIFNSTQQYNVGARADTVEVLSGTIHQVWILNGLGGPNVAPVLPEHWNRPSATAVTIVGAPVLALINGSQSSQGIAYFDNSTRRPKMVPVYGQTFAILASSHNENTAQNEEYMALLDTWATNVAARLPYAAVVLSSQNPRKSPATASGILSHAARRGNVLRLAAMRRYYALDPFPEFTDVATQVQSSDGIHPTTPSQVTGGLSGFDVWANYVTKFFAA